MPKKNPISLIAWCLYDSACASFSVIVTTFIFATYFTNHIAKNPILGTYQWANATALAGIIIALASPCLGAIADHGGYHKRWLFVFTYLCILSSALLWFAYPEPSAICFTLICVVVGTVSLEIAFVFYNSFLPHVVDRQYIGRISGWGWGAGYIGGIAALSIALFAFIQSQHLAWLTASAGQVRICGPFVAAWYAIFSLPMFFLIPDVPAINTFGQAFRKGMRELRVTLKKLPREKNMLLYLIAHMIYTDGLNTLFAFGGIYAAGTFGFSFEQILLFGITMNISAGIGAFLFAFVDDYIGSKSTVLIALMCLLFCGIPILLVHQMYWFWGFALSLCVFVGPVQAASRSMMVHLLPSAQTSTEMFGLYALSGRITAFMGPWLLGVMTVAFDSQRVGMATVLVFFAIGGLLLLPVKVNAK